jgi:hypothetical protein
VEKLRNYIKFRSFLKPLVLLFIIGILSNFTGCFGCPYSFSGASVAPHLKSVAIPFAEDRSGSAEPRLRELLTEKLTQKFIDDNNLQIAEKSSADALLQCVIVSLSDVPAIVSAGENVASRRITITVQVTFKDLVQRRTVFEKQFSNYGDYSGGISERNSGIEDAINKISDDILLDTVSGW